jgi:hypothetical protein
MRRNLSGLFVATAAIALLGASSATQASFYGVFPDAIRCDITDNPSLGSAIFIINSQNQAGVTLYRTIAPSSNTDYVFNGDGTFNSENYPHATNCDNMSISAIIAAGRARYFSDSSGVAVSSGAMVYFNLSACPSGWTRQVQLDRVINPDQPMVLCRKD